MSPWERLPEWAGIAALSIDRDAVNAFEADDDAGKLAVADLDCFGADHFHDHTRNGLSSDVERDAFLFLLAAVEQLAKALGAFRLGRGAGNKVHAQKQGYHHRQSRHRADL